MRKGCKKYLIHGLKIPTIALTIDVTDTPVMVLKAVRVAVRLSPVMALKEDLIVDTLNPIGPLNFPLPESS